MLRLKNIPIRTYIVWNPDLSGKKIVVKRNWLQTLIRPPYYATKKEVEKYEEYKNQTRHISIITH